MKGRCFGGQKQAILEAKNGPKTPRKTGTEEHRDAGNKLRIAFCRPSEFTFCARGLPDLAGTATPFYWNGRAMGKGCGCLTAFPAFGLSEAMRRGRMRRARCLTAFPAFGLSEAPPPLAYKRCPRRTPAAPVKRYASFACRAGRRIRRKGRREAKAARAFSQKKRFARSVAMLRLARKSEGVLAIGTRTPPHWSFQ